MFHSLFVLFLIGITVSSCPSRESILPCACESSIYSKSIMCYGIENDQDLLNAVDALKNVKDIYSFTIRNATLSYIPHDLFNGIELVELVVDKSSIQAFTDTDVAFEGLEDSLETLLVSKCSFLNSWNWSHLKNMKKLMRLDIIEGDLETIGEDVMLISNLNVKDINLYNNKISNIYDYAFTNFTELHFFSLSNNLMEDLKRSMLPNPAVELVNLVLSYNEIRKLPADMFVNMPNLQMLSLSGNRLLTLNEATFSPVWERLEYFFAMRNKLRCDCRISWILKTKMTPNFHADCEQPQNLRGRIKLATLHSEDLWC